MGFEVTEVDVRDEAVLRAWWEVGYAASAGRPYDPWPAWAVSRVALPTHNPEHEMTLTAVLDDVDLTGTVAMVGTGLYLEPVNDNPHLVMADVFVHPDHRRQGIGTALLGDAERRTRAAGRSTVLGEAMAAPGAESPGTLFGRARGYEVASTETTKVVELDAAESTWQDLGREVAEHIGDYRVVSWVSECPAELLDGYCRLLTTFLDEIPLGDLDLESSEWTPVRVRAGEERLRTIGREIHVAAAVAPDGTMVGLSDVRLNLADPRLAEVGVTLVHEAHRGHRLGLALKLATHGALRATHPETGLVVTSNADENGPMNVVNARLGYRAAERLVELQKRLA